MKKDLLRNKGFSPLFWTQFLGAFNDNLFKNALAILITTRAYSLGGASTNQVVALCGGIFMLPYLLFSATAGQLADKYSKSKVIFWIKAGEILAMIIGASGFFSGNLILLLISLFLMGLHSAFFGPVKYSILPQLLEKDELVSANAYVEMGTFIAVLFGTVVGGVLISAPQMGSSLLSVATITTAVLGMLASMRIRPLAPAAPELRVDFNPLIPTLEVIGLTRKIRSVFLSTLGISWFWFLGAAVLSILPAYCKEYLGGDESLITLFLALFSVGVGAGSLLCGRLSRGKLELGLVPVGAIGISLFAFDLFLAGRPGFSAMNPGDPLTLSRFFCSVPGWRIAGDMFLFALFSGLFIVPLYTLVQQRTCEHERSRVIAGNNILSALFMVAASLFLVILTQFGVTVVQIFLLLSVMNLMIALYIYTVIPEFLLRFLCWIVSKIMYRLKVVGREHIPANGPAILVCNHVTFIDWMIIASASPRPVRFVMHYSFLGLPLAGRLFKDAKVIPIAGLKEKPGILRSAFGQIAEALSMGEIVCIFPEGELTGDGEMGEFKTGIERIVQRNPVPVVPMALGGLWGSFFSRANGKPMRRPFRRFWSKISLQIGRAVAPGQVSAQGLRDTIGQLMCSAPE